YVIYAMYANRTIYMLMSMSRDELESATFRNFASTFRFTDGDSKAKVGADAIKLEAVDPQPELITKVEPDYPEIARKARIQGDVELECRLDSNGNVSVIRVSKSLHPILDQAAINAVQQWKYKPYLKNGKPVTLLFNVTSNFHLKTPVAQTSQ